MLNRINKLHKSDCKLKHKVSVIFPCWGAQMLTLLNTLLPNPINFKTNLVMSLYLALSLPFSALADEASIEVSGQGSVTVVPDHFSLTLTITERGRVPSKLKALIDKKSNAVILAAKGVGVKNESITSARVSLRVIKEKPSIQVQGVELRKPRQSVYVDGKTINQSQQQDYEKPLFELSRQITVSFAEINNYDQFLGQVIKINVSHISSLTMSVKERDEYYQQALLAAISHAKEKAQRMAKQAGASIDKLLHVKEQSRNHYQPMYAQALMSDASSTEHSSHIGNQVITARVSVKFSLNN